jgi:FAD/FMN-containing dehydrogenase
VTVFWALRGGGAGSWGVVTSGTFRTFPTFDVVSHTAFILANSSAAMGQLATLHAQHIFDWDDFHVGQFFMVNGSAPAFTWFSSSVFPNASIAAANASMAPFLEAVARTPGLSVTTVIVDRINVNDALSTSTNDGGGTDGVIGSRLIPADTYRYNTTAIGETYQALFEAGTPG